MSQQSAIEASRILLFSSNTSHLLELMLMSCITSTDCSTISCRNCPSRRMWTTWICTGDHNNVTSIFINKYNGIKGIQNILGKVTMMKGGVEAVCESMDSQMEHIASAVRGIMKQMRLEHMVLSIKYENNIEHNYGLGGSKWH